MSKSDSLFNRIAKKLGDFFSQENEVGENSPVEEKQAETAETVELPQQETENLPQGKVEELSEQEKIVEQPLQEVAEIQSQQVQTEVTTRPEPKEEPQVTQTYVEPQTAEPREEPQVATPKVEPQTAASREEPQVTQTRVEPQKTQSQTTRPQASSQQEKQRKVLDGKEKLLRNVITTLSKKIEYPSDTNGKKLVIWLDCEETLDFNAYNTEAYRQQLFSTLVNERGFGFEQVSFMMGKPGAELHATKIGDNDLEYLQVVEKVPSVPEPKSCKAKISIFGDAGSLKKDEYILSPEDMKKRMITAYNIGAGEFPKIITGYRENHIAIDDNPQSPMVSKNQYVSRMHAHIGYSDKFGFYFQVEKDGTRLMGKRTRIFRGEEKIECDNPQARIPLQNGDLIELGKAVVLRFVQLDE